MLGIEDYGSGSDQDSDNEITSKPVQSSFTLPAPKSSNTYLPPKPRRAPKKITISLPNLPPPKRCEEEDDDERPAVKRPRREVSAGRSALLSMLPAPKEKAPVSIAPERVLGGGKGPGLVFGRSRPDVVSSEFVDSQLDEETTVSAGVHSDPALRASAASLPSIPPSLKKGRANISVDDEKPKVQSQPIISREVAPVVDFFSLGAASSSKISAPSTSTSPISSLSSAPVVPTFQPPKPSQTDEYPGYYQLPSGAWAAHDPTYYAKFVKKWQDEYDAHVRALEKGMVKGFEGLETASVEEVNAMKVMEKAKLEIKDREERKAITQGADGGPVAPKMTINASKTSGIARSRHQLSTLLKEAYENREALEEKIAQGKRNRKEAGNKYGF